MLDLSHIPNSQQDIKIFYAASGSNSWQTWQKPRKCNYVWIMCIGGGGGGAGNPGSNNTHATGGGSGAVTRTLYNTQQLPDTLYVQVGLGGAGGAASTNGSAGTRSFVSLQPITTAAQNFIAASGATAAAGGIVNIISNAAGEIASTQTTATFYTLSNFISTAGTTAVQSLGILFGPDITPLTSQITCPGAGGSSYNASTVYSGSSILATSISPLIQGGASAISSGSNAGNGANGITSWKPFYSTGGAGAGSSLSGSGGNGGNGGIGSGGGAGGAGFLGGGRGGNGGDGLVVIISF
jgi:hypothetical protein